KDEATKYGVHFEQHDDRYARTAEWLKIVDEMWKRDHVTIEGKYYRVTDSVMQPKPLRKPRPVIYAGAGPEAPKNLIAAARDAYGVQGAPPERVGAKIADMNARREKIGLGPMIYGVAGYAIVRNSDAEAKAELTRITDVKQSAAGYHNYQQWLAGTQLE